MAWAAATEQKEYVKERHEGVCRQIISLLPCASSVSAFNVVTFSDDYV